MTDFFIELVLRVEDEVPVSALMFVAQITDGTLPATLYVDDVVAKPLAPNLLGYAVPGALLYYGLPDLATMPAEAESTEGP